LQHPTGRQHLQLQLQMQRFQKTPLHSNINYTATITQETPLQSLL
jgi:hypothetical protein